MLLRLPFLVVLSAIQFNRICDAFLSPSVQTTTCRRWLSTRSTTTTNVQRMDPLRHTSRKVIPSTIQSRLSSVLSSSSTRLFKDLWDQMEIDEDEEPQWYLLNCVSGLEQDLLQQCRCTCGGMLDVIKFVVPTITKTRSHGAKRMVRDIKVKYQGYVFAKVRLTRDTYLAIRSLTLCRSWMGTINMKGHRKLPPIPQPLSKEEIESFDLENFQWVQQEQEIVSTAAVKEKERTIIVDTEDYDIEENRILDEIEEEVQTVYKGLKVEDMIKVISKSKFYNEDGMVRRLKEGRVLIRFFTYGTVFDEWLDPSEVRKLTEAEILKGLGGPKTPISQRDLDSPRQDRDDRGDQRFNVDRRNQARAFGGGGGGPRHRRQDRMERQFRHDRGNDDGRERDNWNWYQQQDRRSRGGGYSDGEQHIRGSADQRQSRGNFWAESDVDSQWGRRISQKNTSRRDQGRSGNDNRKRQPHADWSSFISKSSAAAPQKPVPPTKKETDDFFASLMSDLSGGTASRDTNGADHGDWDGSRSDDDFFASLMSEIDDNNKKSKSQSIISPSKVNNNEEDDFFTSMGKDIHGSTRDNISMPKRERTSNQYHEDKHLDDIFAELSIDPVGGDTITSSRSLDNGEDDFFASLERELASDLGEIKLQSKAKLPPQHQVSVDADEDDFFFSNLKMELGSNLGGEKQPTNKMSKISSKKALVDTDDDHDDDEFFSRREKELSDDLNQFVTDDSFDDKTPEDDVFFSSLEKELSDELVSQFVIEGDGNGHDLVSIRHGEKKISSDTTTDEATEQVVITERISITSPTKSTSPTTVDDRYVRRHHNNNNNNNNVIDDRSGLQLHTRTVVELKDMLRQRGLKVSGKKSDLIDRLTATS
jgi:transcription antitermination factor NusG